MTEKRQRTLRKAQAVGLALAIGLAVGSAPGAARAEHDPPAVALRNPDESGRRPFAPRGASSARGAGAAQGSGGWWLGTAGVALALAVFGGVSLASRRGSPRTPAGSMRVVGRASLSPRHTVHLLRVGDRVLIVGTGPQGAPSLLGELDEPAAPVGGEA